MDLIKLFLLGASGYLLAALYDIALLYRHFTLSKVLYLGFFVTAVPYPLFFMQFTSPHTLLFSIVLIIFMTLSLILLIYSVLLEIPLKADKSGDVYTKGTYKICRHPGFLWYTAFNLCTALYFWYAPITMVLLGYTFCNLILVTLEDLVLFPKMFPTYREYKKTTRFLFPF